MERDKTGMIEEKQNPITQKALKKDRGGERLEVHM